MNKPKISMIAAVAKNLAIGKNNQLLWHLPEDLKRFKTITQGHAVIMGSKTFESLGRPLPRRTNIVIAINQDYQAPGAVVAHSIEEAITAAKKYEPEEVFVIGGGSIYKQFLPLADKLYITLVDKDFEADTFFPAYNEFSKVVFSQPGQSSDLPYTFLELERA
jgi:dihydrofolate reductase